ncbi:unnamed protein product [Closterium sp. NIES-54]
MSEHRELASCPASPVACTRRARCVCPPPVPGTHTMALRPSSVPQRVVLPLPPASSLPDVHDPMSDPALAASPTVTHCLATLVTDPTFFATTCRLDYFASLVSDSDFPPSVRGELALGCDVLEDRHVELECFSAAVPHLAAMLLAPEGEPDALDIPTPHSYTEAITVYGLRQAPRKWHDTVRMTFVALGFAPSTADPSLFLRTDSTLPSFYLLGYIDNLVFVTVDSEALALMKAELQKRHACTNLGPSALPLSDLLAIVHSSACEPLALSSTLDESVEPSGPYLELVGCLMYLLTCTRPDLAYPLSILACYVAPGRHRREHHRAATRVLRYLYSTSDMGLLVGRQGPVVLTEHSDASWADDQATQRSSQGYSFSLGTGSVLWRSTRSSSVLSSSCEAKIYVALWLRRSYAG